MSGNFTIKTLVFLALTAHVRTQFIDFFQSLNTFIQPYQTTRRSDAVTKRPTSRRTAKQSLQDAIFFETEDFIKQRETGRTTDPYTATVKPRRKNKNTTKPTTRSPWYQPAINNVYDTNSQIINNSGNENNNDYNYELTSNNVNYNNRQTEKPIVYNNNLNDAQKPVNSRPIYDSRTTTNPLLYRPGVRPAVVDENMPPITNRPITSKPDYRPVTYITDVPVISQRPSRGDDDSEPEIDVGPDEDEMSETEKRRYIEIAEQKCDEYKAMNTKKLVALPLATFHASVGVELNVSTCTPINIPLIIGGKVVSIKEFPHMSLVGWKNIQKGGYSWKCGGTLISEQFILTAGHCTYYDKDYNVISGPPQAVQLGSSYIDGQDSQVVSISTVVRHPKFKLRRSYYDVALIKLVTTVTFSESISPACLGVPPPVGNRIIATGWGRTEFGGDSSPELRSVSVPIWEMSDCRNVWGTSLKLPEGPSSVSQLCAGERSGGKDTCQGDSGGPAQIQDGCSWRVVAVTSVGRSCGAAETPALYAKLPRAFIASQVFSNVKPSNNRNNNGNDNDNNENNNWGVNNNGFNNQGVNQNFGNSRPGNHQTIGNSKEVTGNNKFGNTQSSGSNRDEVRRPGNHQIIGNNNDSGVVTSINTDEVIYRPGNHQTVDYTNRDPTAGSNYFITSQTFDKNRDEIISRPGNHQTVDYNNRDSTAGNNYFITSQTSGNNRDGIISRPGNHQTIDTNKRGTKGNNYFVTSHTSGNNRDAVISRPGNHQILENNNNNRDTDASNNYFITSQSSGRNNRDSVIRPGNHQTIGNNNNRDSEHSESNTDIVFDRPDNQNNNEQTYYYNNEQNKNNPRHSLTETYSDFGSQNSDYGPTEGFSYNKNNNREFIVTNRPWWNN